MVTGLGGPIATESTAKSTSIGEEGEIRGQKSENSVGSEDAGFSSSKGRGGEGEKSPFPHSPPASLSPSALIETPDEDDDEEVSWQNVARASLEKNKPLTVKAPVANKVESAPQPQKTVAKTDSSIRENQQEVTKPKPIEPKTTSSPLPSSPLPRGSATPQPQAPEELPPIEAQFTREELPDDFWSRDPEPPPASEGSSYDDEVFETATSAPRSNGQARAPKPTAKLPFDMPLFNELQTLFPGRIVRIDAKQQKQAEESEESTAPTNEAVNAVESEESASSDE